MQLNIPVILGSVREGRNSYFPAKLLVEKIIQAGYESQLVDFKELPLPFVNSPLEPSDYNKKYPDPFVQKWSDIADKADAFVLVAPEYNYSYSGVLKNALDWLWPEFKYKAFGFVGVSTGQVGGARAIAQLRAVIGAYNAFDIRENVMFGPVDKAFDEQGNLIDESYIKKVDGLIKSLVKAAEAMKALRDSK
jgi:chromate reductase, NAD(P)H dehydrogenase (quinone)